MLHQVVIPRRAPVFQQVIANLLQRQLSGSRHLGRTDSAAADGRPRRESDLLVTKVAVVIAENERRMTSID